jgi:hypothetical protein
LLREKTEVKQLRKYMQWFYHNYLLPPFPVWRSLNFTTWRVL